MSMEELQGDLVRAVYQVPQLRGAIVGLYEGDECRLISSGYPGALYSSRLSVIIEIIYTQDQAELGELSGRAGQSSGFKSSAAPPPMILTNKSKMRAEIVGAGASCLFAGVAAVGVVGGVAAEVPTGGASSFLVLAAWGGLITGAVQCANGIARVAEAYRNPDSASLEEWDQTWWYSKGMLFIDALGVVTAIGSLPFAARNFMAVISRQKAFFTRGLTFAKLKAMNRFERLRVIQEVFAEASRTPEGKKALLEAAKQYDLSAQSLARASLSVRNSVSMTQVISKETTRRLAYGILELAGSIGGPIMSGTPGRYTGSASGSVNWVINLVDSG
jgi:hypothetical protein